MAETEYKDQALEILEQLSTIRDEPRLSDLCRRLHSQMLDQQEKQQQQQQQYYRQPFQQRFEQMQAEEDRRQQQQQQQQQYLPQRHVTAEEFFAVASDVAKRRLPATYQTPVFKCLGDYEKCKTKNDYNACMVMLVICVGRQLIPFVK
jgi:FtsZ-interacting cell division protein ZipA